MDSVSQVVLFITERWLSSTLSAAVYLYKKALFLLSTVHHAFSAATPPPSFPVPSNAGFPVFVDNVLPSALLFLALSAAI